MTLDILIVDDEKDIRDIVTGVLEDEGYSARSAANSDEALHAILERRPSLVLLDVWLQGSKLDGLDLLEQIKKRDPSLPVLVFSGHGNIDTAVAAVRKGAVDFIEKPFESERLLHLVKRATETERLRTENRRLKERVGQVDELTGNSSAINAVRATLKRVAATGSRVLISGPAGVGKEVAARLLHSWSGRSAATFQVVTSARMDPDTVEQELFGVEENGKLVRPGLLEQAHGSTLFLDEIADMPITTQGKILRVLTDQAFMRVGGTRQVHVDVRIVSGSSRDLETEIANGNFREDLFYRLNVVPVAIPPLRDRRDDIAVLADHFLARFAADRRLNPPTLSPDAIVALEAHDWPGNVRQLRNVIERIMILHPTEKLTTISADMLPSEITGKGGSDDNGNVMLAGAPLREAREAFEREYLKIQIKRFSGNVSRTAAFIGMERSALHRKLKMLGITELRGAGDEEA
ncbi:MAG: sigma-54-dependent Fis family transcriptional regulator [Sphingomonadales bacterium]|nr:sigma-54-dependent Fis family transcriptional regulator [Sphingomonadales bacterium]